MTAERAQGAGADDRPAEGRADAEPGADAREQPGVHPRRAVRQHRPRLQLGHGDQARAQARATTWSPRRASAPTSAPRSSSTSSAARPASRPTAAVIVATIRALKMHGGVGRDGPRQGEPRGGAQGPRQPRPPRRQRAQVRRAGGGRDQPVRQRHRRRARRSCATTAATSSAIEAIVCSHWADGSAGTEALAEHVVNLLDGRPALDGRGFRPLYPDEMPLWDKVRHHRDRDLRRRGHHRRQAGARPVPGVSGRRLRPLPDLHRQDPVQLLDRSQPARARPRATSCRSARSGSRAAPSSWW